MASLKVMQMGVRPIIDVVDELRAVGLQTQINLPQIAVVGDQSSGKSSLLEAISGVAFPKGTGTVTRCATQLSMKNGTEWCASVSVAIAAKEGKDNTVRDVAKNVGNADELTKHLELLKEEFSKDFSDDVIQVHLTSPDVPDLTIIDLPGIIRSSTGALTKEDMEQVDAMIKKYIVQSRTIILATIPANVDIATVDVLQRAQDIDQDGRRTIGVITKPDLVDKGAEKEALAVLTGQRKKLLHGYYMVKNRSQQQLNENVSLAEARDMEMNFFEQSFYKDHLPRLGINALSKALTQVLVQTIRDSLPAMMQEIETKRTDCRKELKQIGPSAPKDLKGMRRELRTIVRNFIQLLEKIACTASPEHVPADACVWNSTLESRRRFLEKMKESHPGFDGEKDTFIGKLKGKELKGLKLKVPRSTVALFSSEKVTEEKGGRELVVEIIGYERYIRDEVKELMREKRGREMSVFLKPEVFVSLVESYTKDWKGNAIEFQKSVSKAFLAAAHYSIDKSCPENNTLRKSLKQFMESWVNKRDKQAARNLREILRKEQHPQTENPAFVTEYQRIREAKVKESFEAEIPALDELKTREDILAHVMKAYHKTHDIEGHSVQEMLNMLKAYWMVADPRYVDYVIMEVDSCYTQPDVVRSLEDTILDYYDENEEKLKFVFTEDEFEVHKRESLLEKKNLLRKASATLNKSLGVYGHDYDSDGSEADMLDGW
eukprot:CAMPEP_0167805126 /NCGR_PEP_ID=MMETSP0111_2-20121227/20983_1 /TAXON_ID=91324 /ORGANISM="Lotharella globosa, Strain CCCM811" /LENGTH=716 /DNA_ID=CAMNT_0007702201 /DNA_START=124 /DNA_END=2271 /DNA_ORIENTATION=-